MCKCCHLCWQRDISPGRASGAFFPNSLGTFLPFLRGVSVTLQAELTELWISIPAQSLALPFPLSWQRRDRLIIPASPR